MLYARRRIPGFTLVEILVVIVILSIMIIAGLPNISVFYLMKFSGAGKKIVADIRYAQAIAVSRHLYTGIQFLPNSESYYGYYCNANCFPATGWSNLQDPLTHGNMGVNYTNDSQYKNIAIASSTFGGSTMLVFDTAGMPVDAATGSALTANGAVALSYRSANMTISVVAKSGKVYASQNF